MRNIITPDVLKTMIPQEFEDWREAGEDLRCELTHAVMRDLTCPADWDMNGEYRSEFGGFFPVQVRFAPAHGNFHIVVCSPGDITPSWMVVFIPACGRPFSVISTLPAYSPEVISHSLSLTARLDADGGCSMIPMPNMDVCRQFDEGVTKPRRFEFNFPRANMDRCIEAKTDKPVNQQYYTDNQYQFLHDIPSAGDYKGS